MEEGSSEFNESALLQVINKPADGGITALHMAALNGHSETVQLLLDLGASVTEVTVEDGTTIDLIGAGSTPLHYAACGGNAECCQILITRGASLSAENANGWTPLMVGRSWNRDSIIEMLTSPEDIEFPAIPSPYLCLPLMSIIRIARECGWRNSDMLPTSQDPCVVCLEGKCTVASQGCNHEFCTRCALYLCTTNSTSVSQKGPPGSLPCPLCRTGIVSFTKLPGTRPLTKESTAARASLSLSFCACSCETITRPDHRASSLTTPLYKPSRPSNSSSSNRVSPLSLGSSFRSLSCRKFPSMKLNSGLCMGASDTTPSIIAGSVHRSLRNHLTNRMMSLRRSSSNSERRKSWFCSLNHYVATSTA